MRWRRELIFLPIASYSAQYNLWNDLSFSIDLWNNTIHILYILVSIYRLLCSHEGFVNSVIIPASPRKFSLLLLYVLVTGWMKFTLCLSFLKSIHVVFICLFFQMKVRRASKFKKKKRSYGAVDWNCMNFKRENFWKRSDY